MRTERNGLLQFPSPYRCWLAISNDPDGTTRPAWEQLHSLIWDRLELPISDSFFLYNVSERYPDQVSVDAYPDIISAHPHDTMHTWGDFCDARQREFGRDDAEKGLRLMREHGMRPLVWIDHSNFAGNLLHNPVVPAQPILEDRSGRSCENFTYSLDLIEQAGVRYLWDGDLTRIVGQDRHVGRREWYTQPGTPSQHPRLWAAMDIVGRPIWRRVHAGAFDYDARANDQYAIQSFPDGRTLYRFRRFGEWSHANIDGLARSIDGERLDELARMGGTMIVYTHLGKHAGGLETPEAHIPAATAAALEGLAARYRDGTVMVSGVARMLDYLVLRDAAVFEQGCVDFRADGIRFDKLLPADLSGFAFGVASGDSKLPVRCEGIPIQATIERSESGTVCVTCA